jgi:hypothetical protein
MSLTSGRKQNVTSGHQELQELEARLRETEERLAKVSRGNSPARPADVGASREPAYSQPTVGATAGLSPQAARTQAQPQYSAQPPQGGGRPQNVREDTQALMSGMPGAMPQTPRQYSSNGSDYVMVDRNGEQQERGQYGQSVR